MKKYVTAKKKFLGFVSDMDGVVADTEELWFAGTKNFLQQFGISYSRDEHRQYVGRPPVEDIQMFREKYGLSLSEKDALIARQNEVMAISSTGIKLNDGYLDLLLILEKNRIKISLASSSPQDIINKILDATKIRRQFTSINSAEVFGSKTKAYLAATKSMHLKPRDCFALEDSLSGVMAAKEAGLYCIAVPNQFLNGADFSAADEVHKTIPNMLQNSTMIRSVRK